MYFHTITLSLGTINLITNKIIQNKQSIRRLADESLGEPTEEFIVTQRFTETLASKSAAEKIPLGHQTEDFILECSFRGRQCKDM